MRAPLLLIIAATWATSTNAQDITVEVVNASDRSIVVESPDRRSVEYIDLGERKRVTLSAQQWIRLEMEALRYKPRPPSTASQNAAR